MKQINNHNYADHDKQLMHFYFRAGRKEAFALELVVSKQTVSNLENSINIEDEVFEKLIKH